MLPTERRLRTLVESFRKLNTPIIADAMGRTGAMISEIKPLFERAKMVGPALTVEEIAGDNLMCHEAIYAAQPGDVIVINARGFKDAAVWGATMCLAAKKRGIEGVVVDGAVRDVIEIKRQRFPVFARAISPHSCQKNFNGNINTAIQCGGVKVSPGDIVVGDDDGVVVISIENAPKILKIGMEIVKKESMVREGLHRGKSTIELLGLGKA